MRALLTGLIVLALAGGPTGCFVFDEIEAGEKSMKIDKTKAKAEKKPAEEKPATLADKQAEWWEGAKTVVIQPDAEENPTVRCTLGSQTFFTRQSDCLSRGGRPS